MNAGIFALFLLFASEMLDFSLDTAHFLICIGDVSLVKMHSQTKEKNKPLLECHCGLALRPFAFYLHISSPGAPDVSKYGHAYSEKRPTRGCMGSAKADNGQKRKSI